jgi:hypothetical protein
MTYTRPFLKRKAPTLSQSSGVAQALENTSVRAKDVYKRGIIGLQDPTLRHVLATHRRRVHKAVEQKQCEYWPYKFNYE